MIDKARIFIKSGKGGKGCVSFFRSRYIPFGGPDGGNGGRGGDVYFQGDKSINTLLKFKYNKKFLAEDGKSGEGNNKTGRDGEDMIIRVPIGTILSLENGEVIEILDESMFKILEGGKGGIGNGCLANSVQQTPKYSIPEHASEEMFIDLQLKMIGDIGLIGAPNAGKSSFINSCTNANSTVANYAFTTLEPKLGIYEDIILVDIPGLIEGASLGKGLGFRFLSHVERCKFLLFVIDINDEPIKTVEMLLEELKNYGITTEYAIALNKIELLKKKNHILIKNYLEKTLSVKVFSISIHQKSGIKEVLKYLEQAIKTNKKNQKLIHYN